MPGHTPEDDLFRISTKEKQEYRQYAQLFHEELLQLDKNRNATNIINLASK